MEITISKANYLIDDHVIYEVSTTSGQFIAALSSYEEAEATVEWLETTDIGQWHLSSL